MALYRIIKKKIDTAEHVYEVDGVSEEEALENYATDKYDKVFPQQVKRSQHTELIIENIL